MTKAEEIKTITEFANGLPRDSYLKPWLMSVLCDIEREITSDFPVSPSIIESRRDCEHQAKLAKANADEVIAQANAAAKRIKDAAEAQVVAVRDRLYSQMKEGIRVIGYH